LNKPGRFR